MPDYYYEGSLPTTISQCGCDDSTSSCPTQIETGQSTVLHSGQFHLVLPLLAIDAFGPTGWRFEIDYLRDNHVDAILGPNWDYTQNVQIEEQEGNDVVLATAKNTRELFEYESETTFSSTNNNTAAILTPLGEDGYRVIARGGPKTILISVGSPARISSIECRYGNKQTFTWEDVGGVDLLQSVTDSYDRTIEYRYDDRKRLIEIEDFLGRKLNFHYDDGRLVAVVTPSITQAVEGNTCPGGAAYVFEYDSDNPRPERRDDLIRVWYPNQTADYVDPVTRQVDVARVYADAAPRYEIEYGQDPTDEDHYGRVVRETVGDPNDGPGGAYTFLYTMEDLPENLVDEDDPIVQRAVVTDRNGNQTIYDFNAQDMPVRVEVLANRAKLSVAGLALATSYVTWTKYNEHNQPVLVIHPEGNSVEYEYDDGEIDWTTGGSGIYAKRIGLLLRETHRPGNPYEDIVQIAGVLYPDVTGTYLRAGTHNEKPCYSKVVDGTVWYIAWDDDDTWYLSTEKGAVSEHYWTRNEPDVAGPYDPEPGYAVGTATASTDNSMPSRAGSSGQTELTRRYFYEPLFEQQCAVIERRGNPIGEPLTVSGESLDPDVADTYSHQGWENNRPAYLQDSYEEYWIWWNATDSKWKISVEKGVGGTAYWQSDTLEGDYEAQSPATGVATVDAMYFTPQNLGTTPDRTDRSRYATITYYDYQQNKRDTIKDDTDLQDLLFPEDPYAAAKINDLITHVDNQMKSEDGTGGLPDGFEVNLGDINGDGTGDGTADGSGGTLTAAKMLGSVVKIKHPPVRQLAENTGDGDPWKWLTLPAKSLVRLTCTNEHAYWAADDEVEDNDGGTTWTGYISQAGVGGDDHVFLIALTTGAAADVKVGDGIKNTAPEPDETDELTAKDLPWAAPERVELFTHNDRSQMTTHTDPEGSATVYVHYPHNDPEGDGVDISATLSAKQYGRVKEVHADADPSEAMDLLGADADLTDFRRGKYVSAVLADTPVAYWRLDDPDDATKAADTSGNGIGADHIGETTLNQPGPLHDPGAAVLLEPGGTHGYIDAGDPDDLQIEGNITLEAWVKITEFPGTDEYATIISKGYDGYDTGYWLAIHNDSDDLKLIAGAGSGSAPSTVSWDFDESTDWQVGQWVHVVGQFDGTDWRLFVNGVERGTPAVGDPPCDTSPRKLYIGAFDNNGATVEHFLDGAVAEVAVYNQALPPERILAHYETGVNPSYLDLVTRYEATDGRPAYDASGNVICETNPRGFTTIYDRNELGMVYRTTSPGPYFYRTETHYDANGNVIREDVEDKVVAFDSDDPTDADYAKYTPTGSGYTAHVPTRAGPGGTIRPGWFTNLYEYDLLDNRVAERIDATGSTPSPLVTTYEYDPNQNLVKVTKPEGNVVEYDYDERNLRIATRVGYDPDGDEEGAVTISVYDGNGNRRHQIGASDRLGEEGDTTLTATIQDAFRSGEPLPHTGDWLVENVYDGFDRVIKTTDAVGNVTDYGYDHDTEVCYDPDGRVLWLFQEGPPGGVSPTGRGGGSNVTLAETINRYDEAGRTYETQQAVFLETYDQAYPYVLPSDREVTHTGGGLAANSTADDHDGTADLTDDEETYVLTRNVHDRAGRAVVVAQDNTAKTRYGYDGLGNQTKVTDALGNVVETTYDANGNVVFTRRTEKATIPDAPDGIQDEVFESYACYDALNRLVISASQGGDGSLSHDWVEGCTWPVPTQTLVTRIGYGSRGNQTLVIDPKGNTAVTVYDGAGRVIESVRHLRQDGDGGPPEADGTFEPDGGAAVRTRSVYDGNARLTQLVDDRGGTTTYTYDTLDRRIVMTFHDGSTRVTEYNAAGDVIRYTDENGTKFGDKDATPSPTEGYVYDAIGRLTTIQNITAAISVVGTTEQTFEYDGLSRMTKATDSVNPLMVAECSFYYDSVGRTVEEHQYVNYNRYVTHHAFLSLVPTGLTFPDLNEEPPDTGRQVAYEYDSLYRRTAIKEGEDTIAAWSFFGPARVAELELGNGLILTHMNNARTRSAVQAGKETPDWGDRSTDRLGYDGAGRMITKRYLEGGIDDTGESPTYAYNDPTAVVGFITAFDKASNKTYERHLHAESRSHLYPGLDSMDRLREYQRGTLQQAASGSVTVGTAITLPGTDSARSYDLDGLGNWQTTIYVPVGAFETAEARRHNLLNQVTRFGRTDVAYDHGFNADSDDPDVQRRGNGNVADDGTRLYQYDAFNRLVTVIRKSGPEQVAAYWYDALGRRVRKEIMDGGLPGDLDDGTIDYIYSGVQCLEERQWTPVEETLLRQYVWGWYVDELLQQREVE